MGRSSLSSCPPARQERTGMGTSAARSANFASPRFIGRRIAVPRETGTIWSFDLAVRFSYYNLAGVDHKVYLLGLLQGRRWMRYGRVIDQNSVRASLGSPSLNYVRLHCGDTLTAHRMTATCMMIDINKF